tara:strand:- start:770 stop:1270 length:501 start_codon:yes stop_codon:yes gene_type:complete
MANYELGLTASEIDIALQKAHSPTTSITNVTTSDPSLVTSGAVKAALASQVVVIEDSSAGLTDTDAAVPTSAAVLDANQFSLKAGYTQLHSGTYGQNTSLTGTAPSSGFLMVVSSGASVTVGGISFDKACTPLAKDEVYTITPGTSTAPYIYTYRFRAYFKSFQTP